MIEVSVLTEPYFLMSNAKQIIDLVTTLLEAKAWEPHAVGALVGFELSRDKRAPANLKRYRGSGPGLIRRADVLPQTFGTPGGPALRLEVDWDGAVTRDELGVLIPRNAKQKRNPPPPPGSQGPMRHSFGCDVPDPRANGVYSFESRDKSPDYLYWIGLRRPAVPETPSDFAAECFRAYAMHEGDAHSYAIERRSTHEDAVVVSAVELAGRTAKVSFVVKELMILEPLARKLIRELLLGELLKDELAGKYDQVSYFATELETTTVEPAQSR